MRIPLDKRKHQKRMISLAIMTIAWMSLSVLVAFLCFVKEEKIVQGIVLMILLISLSLLFAYWTKFYFSIRNLEYAFTYENGVLNDYAKPFNKARDVKKEDIKSITEWSGSRGIHQYILIKKNFGLGGNALMHQLKGNHIYLSDYVVDTEALKQMIQLIQSEQTP